MSAIDNARKAATKLRENEQVQEAGLAPTVDTILTELDRAADAIHLLGRIIEQWGTDIVRIASAEDLLTEDGDGDWELVWDRLEAVRIERDRLRALLDPADPAVIDRAARALRESVNEGDCVSWEAALSSDKDLYRADARAVLAALGGERDE